MNNFCACRQKLSSATENLFTTPLLFYALIKNVSACDEKVVKCAKTFSASPKKFSTLAVKFSESGKKVSAMSVLFVAIALSAVNILAGLEFVDVGKFRPSRFISTSVY